MAMMARSLEKDFPEASLLLEQGVITAHEAQKMAKLPKRDRLAALSAAWEAHDERKKDLPAGTVEPDPAPKPELPPEEPEPAEVKKKDESAPRLARLTVATKARWGEREGYLHVSEEYAFAQWKGDLSGMPERTLAEIRPRLLELLPLSALLREAALPCAVCEAWHPLGHCGDVVPVLVASNPPRRKTVDPPEAPSAPPLVVVESVAEEKIPTKNLAAVLLGQLGGKKGGKARMEALCPEQRSEMGRKGAEARWCPRAESSSAPETPPARPVPASASDPAEGDLSRIEYQGEARTLRQWADHLGMTYHTLWWRLRKLGWSIDRAFTTPPQKGPHRLTSEESKAIWEDGRGVLPPVTTESARAAQAVSAESKRQRSEPKRQRAIELAGTDMGIAEIAREVGMSRTQVRTWLEEAGDEQGRGSQRISATIEMMPPLHVYLDRAEDAARLAEATGCRVRVETVYLPCAIRGEKEK